MDPILPIIAGSISSLIFALGTFPMLLKAMRTHNLASYSLTTILLSNLGNGIQWLYIASLPFGPIWLLHLFYTVTTALMLALYLRYELGAKRLPETSKTQELSPVNSGPWEQRTRSAWLSVWRHQVR